MVFFVCEGCNETLKRNQVDKHALKCRHCHAVTCVDCSVTFYGDDYQAHVTCVSEAQKYEKSLYKEKPKKLNPQEAWTELIEEAAARSSEAPKHIQSYLKRLTELGNVPRNKKKFENFLKNSLRLHNSSITDEMWNFIEKIKAANDATRAATESQSTKDSEVQSMQASEKSTVAAGDIEGSAVEGDESTKEAKKKKKDKKRKREDTDEAAVKDEEVTTESAECDESKRDKKKKKKKERQSEAAEETHIESAAAVAEADEDEETKKPKKSKKDKKDKKNKE